LESVIHECDAVDVVTPTDTHYNLVRSCVMAGKDVLVEKPLAALSREANELVHIAESKDRILMVGHIFRYHAATQHVRKMIEAKEIGAVKLLDGRYIGSPGPRNDSGVLMNLAIHYVDLYSYLLGEPPISVRADCCEFSGKGLDDIGVVELRYASGAVGHISATWISDQKLRNIIAVGLKGAIAVDYANNKISLTRSSVSTETQVVESPEPLELELAHFIECIRSRDKPVSDGKSAALAVKTIERAIISSRTGRVMSVDQ
jgi:predicted dehydrogenase